MAFVFCLGEYESSTVASRRLFSALLSFSSLTYASKAASSAHKISRNLSRREVQSSFHFDNFCSDEEKPAENTCVFSRALTKYGHKFRGENRLCSTYICLTQYRGKRRFSGLLIPTAHRPWPRFCAKKDPLKVGGSFGFQIFLASLIMRVTAVASTMFTTNSTRKLIPMNAMSV